MQEIKDEDRIIGRICRGELSITNDDIKNLETANLTEQQEKNFKKLAQEINEIIDRNNTFRTQMRENIYNIQKNNPTCRQELEKINNQIQDLRAKYNEKKYPASWKFVVGALALIIGGMTPALILSAFTSSFWALVITSVISITSGCGIIAKLIVDSQDKYEEIKKQIKELEQVRLEIIEDDLDKAKAQENEIKSNIVKNIYKSKKIVTFQEDELSF